MKTFFIPSSGKPEIIIPHGCGQNTCGTISCGFYFLTRYPICRGLGHEDIYAGLHGLESSQAQAWGTQWSYRNPRSWNLPTLIMVETFITQLVWKLFSYSQYENCSHTVRMRTVLIQSVWKLFSYSQYENCSHIITIMQTKYSSHKKLRLWGKTKFT